MPSLKPRHEEFCRHFLLDPNATRAALAAGYSPPTARQQGSRLIHRGDVAARLGDLRADVARRHCLDLGSLLAKLEAVYRRAMEDRQCYAAVRAVELQARLAGLFAEAPRPAVHPAPGLVADRASDHAPGLVADRTPDRASGPVAGPVALAPPADPALPGPDVLSPGGDVDHC